MPEKRVKLTPQASNAPTAGRGTVQILIARMVFLASGFLISVILARGLGPVEFGVYGVVMSILVWIEAVLSAGIPGATANLLAQREADAPAVEQSAKLLLLAWSLVLFALCWALSPALAKWLEMPGNAWLLRIAFVDIPLMGVYFAYQGILQGHRLFGMFSVSLIIQVLTKLVGIVFLLAISLTVAGAFIAHVVATAGVVIFLLIKFPVGRALPNSSLMRSLLRFALPMGAYMMAIQVIFGVGLWILKGAVIGQEQTVGFYVAALNVTRVLLVVPSVVTGVMFVALSWSFAKSAQQDAQKYLQGATRFALVCLLPGCVLLLMDAHDVMGLLYSDRYRPGGDLLRYQTVAFGVFAFLDIFFHALMAAGSLVYSAGVLLALVPITVLLTIVLVPVWGGEGAALALLVTICLGTAIGLVFVVRRIGPVAKSTTIVRVGVATAIMAIVSALFPVSGLWLVPKFLALLSLYVAVLVALRELTISDLKPLAVWQTK